MVHFGRIMPKLYRLAFLFSSEKNEKWLTSRSATLHTAFYLCLDFLSAAKIGDFAEISDRMTMLLRKIVFPCFVERQRWIMMWTKKHPVEQKLGRMLFVLI